MKDTLVLLHGPNLGLLGTRRPDLYGTVTLEQITQAVSALCSAHGADLLALQSNHEGVLLDTLGELLEQAAHGTRALRGMLVNLGAWTHTSLALRDALEPFPVQLGVPVVEIHLTATFRRERVRRRSLLSPICQASIAGLGAEGYLVGARALLAPGFPPTFSFC